MRKRLHVIWWNFRNCFCTEYIKKDFLVFWESEDDFSGMMAALKFFSLLWFYKLLPFYVRICQAMSVGVHDIFWPLFGHVPTQFDTDFWCITILAFSNTKRGSARTTSGSKRQRHIAIPTLNPSPPPPPPKKTKKRKRKKNYAYTVSCCRSAKAWLSCRPWRSVCSLLC